MLLIHFLNRVYMSRVFARCSKVAAHYRLGCCLPYCLQTSASDMTPRVEQRGDVSMHRGNAGDDVPLPVSRRLIQGDEKWGEWIGS